MRTLRSRLAKIGERGDTIVEVLIAIAVVSLVLGGAYTTTNRSLQASRSAQEQGAALKVVEAQLEQLKSLAQTVGGLASLPSSFCITSTSGKPAPISTADPTNPCGLNATGVKAASTEQPVYQIAITRPSANTFQIQNKWEDVNGKTSDLIQMTYKVYPQ